MALILPVKGILPLIPENCFIAENSTLVGAVILGQNCSVWFNAVVRGDVNSITIGDNSNIQDGAVIHCTYLKASTVIGNNVSIGHNALVHGCVIHDHVLIGMGAIVMDHSIIEDFCIIAAGAIVLEKMKCESGFLYAGIPARKIKPLTDEQISMLKKLPENYKMYASWFNPDLEL
jgi:carbonic anhydrase/acetyltransferase-like protein (isoleucine patch superfamily)